MNENKPHAKGGETMIIENSLEIHGYAVSLICDYHGEYVIPRDVAEMEGFTRAYVVYDAFAVTEIQQFLGMGETEPFVGLDVRYNGYYGPGMSIWLVQGSLRDLTKIFEDFAEMLQEGPTGSDDDVYDYWPNAVDMLIVLARDLMELGADKIAIVGHLINVKTKAIANRGDREDWESQWDAINELKEKAACG